ncbi:hypothetical protein MSG28_011627 [Choristoneura fumiferana]|uniref:Uncharacterized protein n=1 Tax=Choristoneura fumiferana TaxID=7141 RepID=A0ACC0KM39_CHOFU|nr:hypothetical protein MSG28_011627 [Choristoneura fumiferana]
MIAGIRILTAINNVDLIKLIAALSDTAAAASGAAASARTAHATVADSGRCAAQPVQPVKPALTITSTMQNNKQTNCSRPPPVKVPSAAPAPARSAGDARMTQRAVLPGGARAMLPPRVTWVVQLGEAPAHAAAPYETHVTHGKFGSGGVCVLSCRRETFYHHRNLIEKGSRVRRRRRHGGRLRGQPLLSYRCVHNTDYNTACTLAREIIQLIIYHLPSLQDGWQELDEWLRIVLSGVPWERPISSSGQTKADDD